MPPPESAGFAGPVIAVGVEELENPVIAVDFDVRLHGHDLTLDGQHVGNRAPVQRVQLRPGRRQQEATAGFEFGDGGLRRGPLRTVGFGVVAVGTLTFRQHPDEEVGVIATGALGFGRHPVGPRPQQIGSQHQVFAAQEVGERQRPVGQRLAGFAVDRCVADDAVRVVGRAGEQHAAFLEGFAGGGAHQRLGQLGVGAEPLRPPRRRRPGPGDVGVAVAVVDAAAGEYDCPGGEFHCGVPSHQEHRDTVGGLRAAASRSRPAGPATGHTGRQS